MRAHGCQPLQGINHILLFNPETPLAARLSIPFAVALALIDKEVSLKQFTRERLDASRIKDMMERTENEEDISLNA